MIKIIATVCSLMAPADCQDTVVASDVTMTECLIGMPKLAAWMGDHPGYRLEKWRCFMGVKATAS